MPPFLYIVRTKKGAFLFISPSKSIRHQVSGTRQSVEMTLLSLPLYLVGQLGRLLDRLRQER